MSTFVQFLVNLAIFTVFGGIIWIICPQILSVNDVANWQYKLAIPQDYIGGIIVLLWLLSTLLITIIAATNIVLLLMESSGKDLENHYLTKKINDLTFYIIPIFVFWAIVGFFLVIYIKIGVPSHHR